MNNDCTNSMKRKKRPIAKSMNRLRVAIINNDNQSGKIADDKKELLENVLVKELDKTFSSPAKIVGGPLAFVSCSYVNDILQIICKNDHTVKWLKAIVTKLRPWKGASLGVMDSAPKVTKASLWIPVKPNESLEKQVIINRLKRQNPTLNINKWNLCQYETKEDPQGFSLIFEIGETDITTLKKNLMKIDYLFGSIPIKINQTKKRKMIPAAQNAPVSGPATATEIAPLPTMPEKAD